MSLGSLVCVFGVSGVGKSFLITRLVATTSGWAVLRAGELLSAATGRGADELRKSDRQDIERNQHLLVKAIWETRRSRPLNYLLDGHCVIDNGEQLVAVSTDVVAALEPALILLVHDSPERIADRAAVDYKRLRAVRSTAEIRLAQDFAASVCERYAREIQVQYGKVCAGDEATFAAFIRQALDESHPP